MTDVPLRLDRIGKTYGGFAAVSDLSFAVARGEIYGFLGPNGAGKTTTLRTILDIVQPSAGSLEVLGAPSAGPVRHRIGYLPEERGLYRKMRTARTIAYFTSLHGVPGREALRRARRLLDEFGLGAFADARNDSLSKGMAQKVQLLAAIAHDPDLLILDEPFSGLDPINQAALETFIRAQRDSGKTVLFSTHVMAHAERLCDRFLILAGGRKRFEGTIAEARALLPRRLSVRTPATREALLALPGVGDAEAGPVGAKAGDPRDWTLDLADDADPQTILGEALRRGLAVLRFDVGDASLHDIFVALAGDAVDPAKDRGRAAA